MEQGGEIHTFFVVGNVPQCGSVTVCRPALICHFHRIQRYGCCIMCSVALIQHSVAEIMTFIYVQLFLYECSLSMKQTL
jgi:hypothetical protein